MALTPKRPGRLRRALAVGAVLALPLGAAACADDETDDDPGIINETPGDEEPTEDPLMPDEDTEQPTDDPTMPGDEPGDGTDGDDPMDDGMDDGLDGEDGN